MPVDEDLLNTLWQRRTRWSNTATRMKRHLDRVRLAVLFLGSWGAIATAATTTVLRSAGAATRVVALSGAVALAVATFLTAQYLTPESTRRWTIARAVSEGIKHRIVTYRAIGDARRAGRLRADVEGIEQTAEDLLPLLAPGDNTVEAPRSMRPDEYVRGRVRAQIDDYYLPAARRYRARASRMRRAAIGLGLAATIVAAINTGVGAQMSGRIAPWVAVMTTLSGSLLAYLAGKRYDFLVMTYLATADRLRRRLERWRADGSPTDPLRWAEFVADCENTISLENASWMAKWGERTEI
ncbi:DUF4231 domain-containing protein [Nocardia alba]|uniref:SMODS and SLOG-associating 2TM effector domain-containing protein n=1 Tax=Nocardia alba TaxID=225051 RepID=A0A4R1FJL4_9NOCA|nr:DUF4231 domain-containing protein [Nocardia alba]TCJ93552.1 hypothetical protein DFR71_5401 [Nocardia alba]